MSVVPIEERRAGRGRNSGGTRPRGRQRRPRGTPRRRRGP
jgi:hypothetical protein